MQFGWISPLCPVMKALGDFALKASQLCGHSYLTPLCKTGLDAANFLRTAARDFVFFHDRHDR